MIEYAPEALADLERILAFNAERAPDTAATHIRGVLCAVEVLEAHPYLGRRISSTDSLRELVVSHGSTGYVALYEADLPAHVIRIVAVRHQREAGYRRRTP